MKELKAFLVVIIVTGAIYWGVEPYAHSILHPHVEPANFDFAKEDTTLAKTNVEKAFDKLYHPSMIKTQQTSKR